MHRTWNCCASQVVQSLKAMSLASSTSTSFNSAQWQARLGPLLRLWETLVAQVGSQGWSRSNFNGCAREQHVFVWHFPYYTNTKRRVSEGRLFLLINAEIPFHSIKLQSPWVPFRYRRLVWHSWAYKAILHIGHAGWSSQDRCEGGRQWRQVR